jgi:hypothetical protein
MASLACKVDTDTEEPICDGFECEESRPLVLPSQHINRWLFDFAAQKISEAFDHWSKKCRASSSAEALHLDICKSRVF